MIKSDNEIPKEIQKQLEETARQKALYDYNTLMEESYERGIQYGREEGRIEGREEGREEGRIELAKKVIQQMRDDGIDEKIIKRYFGTT